MTEAYPTCHHTFNPRRMLTPDESVDDYMEVTAAEQAKLEAADARWVRPEQAFIDIAVAAGLTWNESTGYFEYGVKPYRICDIGQAEALEMLQWRSVGGSAVGMGSLSARCTLSALSYSGYHVLTATRFLCYYNPKIEVLNLGTNLKATIQTSPSTTVFQSDIVNCPKLRAVVGHLYCVFTNNTKFDRLPMLEWLTWSPHAGVNVSVPDSPLLRLDALQQTIKSADTSMSTTTKECIYTVHPDVYAKLAGTDTALSADATAAWQQVMADAAAKNIIFATTN